MGIKECVAPKDEVLDKIENALLSIPDVKQKLIDGVARAIDEVIDPVRSARWTIEELDKPEKTIFGTRVENVLRMELGLERSSKLDIRIANEDVDVKFTVGSNWTIPPEALGEVCLIAKFSERNKTVSAGLIRTSDEYLNEGKNRDKKRTINEVGREKIRWIVKDAVAESSIIGFMAGLPAELRKGITDSHVSAQERQNRLFKNLKNIPIPETLVEAISQHKDWTRRLRPDRSNPNAPGDALSDYDVLRQSSAPDRNRLKKEGRPPLKKGFCMSVDP